MLHMFEASANHITSTTAQNVIYSKERRSAKPFLQNKKNTKCAASLEDGSFCY